MDQANACAVKKIILHCGLSPGDIVMLTAAVRDLHLCYPGRYLTGVRTSCAELWDNNPYVTPLDEADPTVETIDCAYPLINQSNRTPYHCLHGFIDFLNTRLGLNIRPTRYRGDIHLSPPERAWYSQVRELAGRDIPFWIIASGGKFDVTIKWWAHDRYQAVVDAFRGKIQFVQVGAAGHHHPKLDGVIDLRGKTNLRQLVRLTYHAQGILCPVTALMHLAAAVESKAGEPAIRPCVVVAGGREPAHWEQYPGHQFLHTIGALSCCQDKGCWRGRVEPLRDGDHRDQKPSLCANVVQGLPRCLDMISAEEVVQKIAGYFAGGVIRYLTPAERTAAMRGVVATAKNDFDALPLNIHTAGLACDRAAASPVPPLPAMQGRGIVICAGGIRLFTNAWVCIQRLRRLGCTLPIEVWHIGPAEMDAEMSGLLQGLGVSVVDAAKVRLQHPLRILNGWELKPYAMAHSAFAEVLLLDADNVPVLNPEFLFDSREYKSTGAIFWPDYDRVPQNNQLKIWRSCGLRRPNEKEFETGQILLDKRRCWHALNVCLWFNANSDFYYRHLHGDKETFHLAFRKVGKSYHLIPHPVKPLEKTMCQHDPAGRVLFQHRNRAKWDLVHNPRIKGFLFEQECLAHLADLKPRWSGKRGKFQSKKMPSKAPPKTPLKGAGGFTISAIMAGDASNPEIRRTVKNLCQQTDWQNAPVHYCEVKTADGEIQWRNVFEQRLKAGSDFLLLLSGNLTFNRQLVDNLQRWRPFGRDPKLASIYNSGIHEVAIDSHSNARLLAGERQLESRAMVISRDFARLILDRSRRIQLIMRPDFLKLQLKLKTPVYFHAPSLTQTAGKLRLPNGHPQRAFDFDPIWKAKT
ncbi:MAG TPA: glycosyltransferase family 9 protein [Verrucomicrobiae bacterium]|jgi:ADP-heptose:LPS heptosyltransferase